MGLESEVKQAPWTRESVVIADQADVAENRVRFLTHEPPEPRAVRGPILASWRRSHDLQVPADKIHLPYVENAELDTRLTRSADPVLRSLSQQLDGQSVSVILTDPSGLVVRRLTGDSDLERHLERVLLAPGFSYAEEFVGTNGIGTALEVGGPAHVFGHEHYAENLEDLACAGVPIHHPVSGRLVGAVDLTCWRKDAGALLLALAKTTAEQIRQVLLAEAGACELELFQEYLRACSRGTEVVLAVNDHVVMMNDVARTVLEPAEQAVLLAQATEAMVPRHRRSFGVDLPSGQTARMHCRRVQSGERFAGVVAHVRLEDHGAGHRSGGPSHPEPLAPLPGLVGSSPVWLRVCHELESTYRSGEWLVLEGEPGVGKLALLRSVQLRRQPVGRFVVLEPPAAGTDRDWLSGARRAILRDADTVVLRHADRLDGPALRDLSAALQEARTADRPRPLWAAATVGHLRRHEDLRQLLRLFPRTLDVPPLRVHVEDLQPLATLFLSRLEQGGHLSLSPAAVRLLMRMPWPGNAEQLHQLLREVVTHRRTGCIQVEDLPPETHSVSRRVLSPLESMERDAIVRSLSEADGNKVQAARALGMSRATIYRKIHDYGIVVAPQG